MNNHTAKAIFMFFFILMAPIVAIAQAYTVYSVNGDVYYANHKGRSVKLTARKVLRASDKLTIGKESAVTLLDERLNKMYSLTKPGKATVKDLIPKHKDKTRTLSAQYMRFLKKQLLSSGSQKMLHPNTYMHATATAYRSTEKDSCMMNRIIGYFMQYIMMGGFTPEAALFYDKRPIGTDYDVEFDLVSYDTGEAYGDEISPNSNCYIRVTNKEQFPIYVNIIDLDENGGKYLVLPIDEECSCSHLLVPANTTLAFKSEPFIFPDAESEEMFMLIATEEPVDFSILLSPMKVGNAGTMRAGIHRRMYKVSKN